MDRFSRQLDVSEVRFSQRLEHASHNVLQSVEGMREAAAGLIAGTAGLDLCYTRLADMYDRFEPVAARVAASHGDQQDQLAEIAAGLHGITQSLTSVVASANESQTAVLRITETVAAALTSMQEASARMEVSVERLAAALEAGACAGGASRHSEGAPTQSVSLRLIMEQQQQFINVLDQRLASSGRSVFLTVEPGGPYSSSSSSRSSSRSSSSRTSSSAT
jgi:hypothetical protein